jgi:bacillithiol synthase
MMESTCVRYSELPGFSRLFTDLLYHFDRVAPFFPSGPPTLANVVDRAAQIEYPAARRAAMARALEELNPGHAAVGKFAQADTLAVLTGQQAGLYTGPAYTLYKALTAIRVAAELDKQGKPAVAVFWLATEDHDAEEIRTAWLLNGNREANRIAESVDSHGEPVGMLAAPRPTREELLDCLGDLPFAEEATAMAMRAYDGKRSWAAAFVVLLKEMLGQLPILFADPLNMSLRKVGKELIEQAALRHGEICDALLQRNGELSAAGYHAQVHVESSTSLLFVFEDDHRRTALKRAGNDVQWRGQKLSPAALAELTPRLSPNALLRPVWQDFMFPTAALVAGPGELAYFAQASVVYEKLLGRMSSLLPRCSVTLLDGRAKKLMDRNQMRLADILKPREEFRAAMAQRLAPPTLTQDFANRHAQLASMLSELRRQLSDFDPTLAAALDNSGRRMRYQLGKVERKTQRELLRREGRVDAEVDHLYGNTFPERHMQERLVSALGLIAIFGPELAQGLYEAMPGECPDHQLITVA